jgi:hypothetical protein
VPVATLVAGLAAVALVALAGLVVLPGLSRSAGSSPSPASSTPVVAVTSPSPTTAPTPTASPSPAPTASPAPPTPSPSPTIPPGRQARIDGIALDGATYVVDYTTYDYDPVLPGGPHVHFFFDTVTPAQAGVPGSGPWFLYAGPAPFRGYDTSDRPARAQQLCVLVANPDHSVIQNTGNCVDLPE